MWTIAKKEFINMLRSMKAIIVILIFTGGSFFVSNSLSQMTGKLDGSEYYSSLRLFVFIFGYLFATILSHNAINSEIETKTIRLLLTKTSKTKFVLGKFLGILLFWAICLSVSFLSVSLLGKVFEPTQFIMVIVMMAYFNSIVLLLSAVIERSAMTNFLGLLIALAFPAIGLWVTLSIENPLHSMQLLFPYYYILQGTIYMVIPFVLACLLIGCTILNVYRKDF